MNIRHELLEAIDLSFTKDQLTKGYEPYIRELYSKGNFQVTDLRIQSILEKKKKNKEDLVTLVAAIFSDKKFFQEFKSMISTAAARLFEVLVWEDHFVHEDEIKSEYGIEVTTQNKGSGWRADSDLKIDFYMFSAVRTHNWSVGYQYLLGISEPFRKEILGFFDKPEGYYLVPVEEIPENLLRFNGEEIIFQELPRLLVYANQDNIKLTTSGIPVASTYNKMRKVLSIQEFYEGLPKPFDALRTSLIATLLAHCGKLMASQDGLLTLKQLFSWFTNRFYPLHLLQHLKGTGHIRDHNKYKTGKNFIDILQQFPEEGGWVSMNNIYKFSGFRSLDLKPADDYSIGRHVYFPVERKGYTQKEQITASSYARLIKKPSLQAGFFLFAAFGLTEAAFENPEEEDGEENTPQTPYFHTLRYVRLTPLGAYICGRSKEYVPPKSEEKAGIQLLDDSLNILSDKPSQTVDLLLDNYTVKVGSSRYKTDFGIFMKGVRNADELESKISLFRQTVTSQLPPNWDKFFNTLMLKCDPLKSIGAHVAYQLSKEDQELIQLVAKDPVLKKLTIKAEGMIIMVMKNDQAKFKNRLKEFGYLLE